MASLACLLNDLNRTDRPPAGPRLRLRLSQGYWHAIPGPPLGPVREGLSMPQSSGSFTACSFASPRFDAGISPDAGG